jgi:hypothetical protein
MIVNNPTTAQLKKFMNETQQGVADGFSKQPDEHLQALYEVLASPEVPLSELGAEYEPMIRLMALTGVASEILRRREVADLEG